MLTVALGSLALSFIGSIGAALTLGVRRGGVLLSILILPLAVPILIFGSRATELAIRGRELPGAHGTARGHRGPVIHSRAAGRRCRRAHQSGVDAVTWTWFHRLGSPPYIYRLAGRLTPWFGWIAAVLLIWPACTTGW